MTGVTNRNVHRTVFATARAAEFLDARKLIALIGQPTACWGDVVVKELLDNALDAAESAGVAPVIDLSTRADGELTYVTVTDNGGGISPSTVQRITDYDLIASDKARYRGPTRGSHGNALKCLLAIPAVLGVGEPVIIDSVGIRHRISVSADPSGAVNVSHQREPGRSGGTAIAVPPPVSMNVRPIAWTYHFAMVNPHACFTTTSQHAESGQPKKFSLYKSAAQGWSKWTPDQPSNPWWYGRAEFEALVYAYINAGDKPLGAFICEFAGLARSRTARAVRESAAAREPDLAAVTCLSQLSGRSVLIQALFDAMLRHAKRPTTTRLGAIGKDHFRKLLDDIYQVVPQRYWYRKAELVTEGDIPWVIEAAVAETRKRGAIWYGVNHSAAYSDPLSRVQLRGANTYHLGTDAYLHEVQVCPGDTPPPTAAVVHVICAAPNYSEQGKTALTGVPGEVADAAAAVLGAVTKTLRRETEQRRKDAAKADRDRQRRLSGEREPSQKDAVNRVMRAARDYAGGTDIAARTLYYQVRRFISEEVKRELDYGYFSQTLLPQFQRDHADDPLPGVYYEPRGTLVHPHEGDDVALGTREVQVYIPPDWQFTRILYIEKTGLRAQLDPYQLGQRYDMAIVWGQGYAVKACRDLLAHLKQIHDITIFVLHDADSYGYSIARTLGEDTKRMPDHNIEVIDLGLTAPQAKGRHLQTESWTRKTALPKKLDYDEVALDWFTGIPYTTPTGTVHYKATRCELNAFRPDDLAAFIEEGLRAVGATEKVIPLDEVLAEHVDQARRQAVTQLVSTELHRIVDIDAITEHLLDDHPDLAQIDADRVRGWLTENPTQWWKSAGKHLIDDDVAAADLTGAARTLLLEAMRDETTEGNQT